MSRLGLLREQKNCMEPNSVTNLQIAEQESRGLTTPITGESSGVNIDSVVDDVSSIASNLEFDAIRQILNPCSARRGSSESDLCSSTKNSQR